VDISFFDSRWYWWNRNEFLRFQGWKITTNNHPEKFDVSGEPDVKVVQVRRYQCFDKDPRYIATNKSSGAGAINVAYHLGAKEVVLLGFDMRRVGDRKNWCEDRNEITNPNPYPGMLPVFPKIKKVADQIGLKIVNATPGSKIECFPSAKLEDYP
jgi:hypothetical protein